MVKEVDGYRMSDRMEDMRTADIAELLATTYWAANRSQDDIEESIRRSLPFGLFRGSRQIGFARVVTDGVSVFWLCDVVIHKDHRGQGLGKMFLDFVLREHTYRGLGILITQDAHRLYEGYGYQTDKEHFMVRSGK